MVVYKGNIEWYDNKKGFGIIKPYDTIEDINNGVFLHYSEINLEDNNRLFIKENDEVEFEIEYDISKNKYKATNVKCDTAIIIGTNRPQKKLIRKNTESFEPNHKHADMRIMVGNGSLSNYPRDIYSRDLVIIPNFTNIDNVYQKLLNEIKDSEVDQEGLWKLWHGDTHLIADDHLKWKSKCPTFNLVIEKISRYFSMDIKATRFNLYRDSNDWKPFHHDAAAVKEDKAKTQNFTIGLSFGLERSVCFQHAKTRQTIDIPLDNDSLYAFSKDINIEWRHGIPQIPPEKYKNEGRISIIAWGKIDMMEN